MAGNFYRPKKSVQICKLKVFFRTTSASLTKFSPKVSLLRRVVPLSNPKAHAGEYQLIPAPVFR
jgi:hypothetical protein